MNSIMKCKSLNFKEIPYVTLNNQLISFMFIIPTEVYFHKQYQSAICGQIENVQNKTIKVMLQVMKLHE